MKLIINKYEYTTELVHLRMPNTRSVKGRTVLRNELSCSLPTHEACTLRVTVHASVCRCVGSYVQYSYSISPHILTVKEILISLSALRSEGSPAG